LEQARSVGARVEELEQLLADAKGRLAQADEAHLALAEQLELALASESALAEQMESRVVELKTARALAEDRAATAEATVGTLEEQLRELQRGADARVEAVEQERDEVGRRTAGLDEALADAERGREAAEERARERDEATSEAEHLRDELARTQAQLSALESQVLVQAADPNESPQWKRRVAELERKLRDAEQARTEAEVIARELQMALDGIEEAVGASPRAADAEATRNEETHHTRAVESAEGEPVPEAGAPEPDADPEAVPPSGSRGRLFARRRP
jgi:chromosome segregation ATPase